MTISHFVMIRFARIIGAACVTMLALVCATTLAAAQSSPKLSPLPLTPAARSAPQAAMPVAAKIQHKPQRTIIRAPMTGIADLAFLSAGQYLDLFANDGVIPVVAETEFSLLDFAAGTVRVVDPDELTEIDLANDPDVLLAQRAANLDTRPIVQVSAAAPARTDDSDDDDGVLNRILMTFAGALAMASAMRMIIA